jgi:YVTN family beta-propeller protein
VNASDSGASASTGASVRQVPPGMAMSTGAASSSTESNSGTLANSDGAAELTIDRSLPKPVADSTATDPEATSAAMTPPTGGPRRGSNRHQPQVDNPTGAPGVEATTRTATRTAALSRLEVSPPPPVLIDIAMREPAEQQPLTALNAAAQQPLTAVNAVPHLPPQVNFIAQALPAARTEPTEPPNMVRSVVLAALATVGLGPLAANGPVLPADSPVGWALLAVGARRFGQPAIQETRNLPATPTMTSQSIDGAATSTAIASPAATVNSVSAYLSPTYLENQASIGVGTKPSGVVVSPDGQRLYVANTGSGTVSVINTATGRRIDASPSIFSTDIKVGSSPSGLALSPDGNRLYVANTGSGTVSVITTDTYKLIDTNTGASLGSSRFRWGPRPAR